MKKQKKNHQSNKNNQDISLNNKSKWNNGKSNDKSNDKKTKNNKRDTKHNKHNKEDKHNKENALRLRVSSGIYKNAGIEVGTTSIPVRERVKQSVFSTIGLDKFKDANILDLFAGSGNLGIEALSNEATFCTFIDNNYDAIASIRSNLDKIGLKYMTSLSNATNADNFVNTAINQTKISINNSNSNIKKSTYPGSSNEEYLDFKTSSIRDLLNQFSHTNSDSYTNTSTKGKETGPSSKKSIISENNLSKETNLNQKIFVIKEETTKFIQRSNIHYDIIFIDPPYYFTSINHIAKIIDKNLHKKSVLVYFKSKDTNINFEKLNTSLKLSDQKKYGITVVDFIVKK